MVHNKLPPNIIPIIEEDRGAYKLNSQLIGEKEQVFICKSILIKNFDLLSEGG